MVLVIPQKRSGSTRRALIAITAPTGEMLETRGIVNTESLQQVTLEHFPQDCEAVLRTEMLQQYEFGPFSERAGD